MGSSPAVNVGIPWFKDQPEAQRGGSDQRTREQVAFDAGHRRQNFADLCVVSGTVEEVEAVKGQTA